MSDGSAEAFEALLAQRGGDLLVLVDDRLRIVRAGPEAAALAGRPEGGLEGLSIIAAFGSASLDAVAREAQSARQPTRGEADLGALGARHFAVDAVPLAAGGLVVSLHDVTALRRIERVRRDFVANISHELRTPLSSIKLLAETMSSGSVDDPSTSRDFAAQIEREVDHLAQLVDELLDLSRIESGETQLALQAVDAEAAIDDCLERIGPVAARRSIEVAKDPRGQAARAMADPARLGQALLNLAHNAVKYSQPGSSVRAGWETRGSAVRFLVADDGAGVPAAHQARIFERFYKVDRSRTRPADGDDQLTGSAGLGLAIVRHIAEAHGGTVGLTSAEGVGSTFWIEVPLAQ